MAEEVKWDIRETSRADVMMEDGDFGDVVSVNEYAVVGYLGEGSFGRVFRAQRRAGGKERDFAIKEMSKMRLAKKRELRRSADGKTTVVTALDNVQRTVGIHRHLYHRHVMLLFEVINDPEEDRMYLVTEYMAKGPTMWWDNSTRQFHFGASKKDGSGTGVMPISTARRFTLHAALGLQYLHGLGIVHRDVKPENLLVNNKLQCVLSDLGSCHKFEGEDVETGTLTDTAGTYAFLSPDVCAGGAFDAYKADVWALGVTLYAFVHGVLPFWEDGGMQPLFDTIQTQELVLPKDSPAHTNPGLRDLLESLLTKDPKKRPTIAEVVSHPWLASYQMEEGDEVDKALAQAAERKAAARGAGGGKTEE